MISEFIKDHKKLCIITLIVIIILILIIVNKNSSETLETSSNEEEYYDDIYDENVLETEETLEEKLDETQSTRYNDINYGTEE